MAVGAWGVVMRLVFVGWKQTLVLAFFLAQDDNMCIAKANYE